MAVQSPMADSQPLLYDYIKIKFKIESSVRLKNAPQVTWKDFKKQWVVLSAHVAPQFCFLTYCAQENAWLANKQSLPRILLDNFLLVNAAESGKSSKTSMVELMFARYSIVLDFGSLSKLKQWIGAFEKIRSRLYSDLVRCPEHPEREKEYVIQLSPNKITFFSTEDKRFEGKVEFQWDISVIKRAKYHHQTGKVQVEVGRSAESGAGIYYFIGFSIKRFYFDIKRKIEIASKEASLSREKSTRDTVKISSPVSATGYTAADEGTAAAKSSTLPLPPVPRRSTSVIKEAVTSTHSDDDDSPPPPLPPRPQDFLFFGDDDILTYDTIKDEDESYDVVRDNDSPLFSPSSEVLVRRSSEPAPPPVPPRTGLHFSSQSTSSVPSVGQKPLKAPRTLPRQLTEPDRKYQSLIKTATLQPESAANYENSSSAFEGSYSFANDIPIHENYSVPRPTMPDRVLVFPPRPPPYPPPN